MKSDFHMHTNFSSDSVTSPEQQVEKAIELGLETICFTDHHDYGYPQFELDMIPYIAYMQKLQETYKNQINIRIGVELGMQPSMKDYAYQLENFYPLDFTIGSIHFIGGKDPCKGDFFEGKTDEEAYREALEYILQCVQNVSGFDVLGHVDYVVRYGKEREKFYSYQKYADIIDEMLKTLVDKGKGLELNMAGLKYGLPFAHPHPDILKRYRELGGEIITVGSDGHCPEHIAYQFEKANDILKDCGFSYYTEFRKHKPIFKRL